MSLIRIFTFPLIEEIRNEIEILGNKIAFKF